MSMASHATTTILLVYFGLGESAYGIYCIDS